MNNRMQRNVIAIALAIATVFGTAQAQQTTLFDTHILPESLVFEPTQHQSMSIDVDLVVSGPEGFYLRKRYPSGSLSEFNPSDFPDLHFPDGTYTYEVRVMRMGSEYRTRDGDGVSLTANPHITPVHGAFSILDGAFVTPMTEPGEDKFSMKASTEGATTSAQPIQRVQSTVLTNADGIIRNSLCVGFDCANNETFGFDTIRMKENNTRIKFQDTSTAGGFPSHDWQLTANDSNNGGLNKFSIENTTLGRIPFTIVGNAPTNSLWVANNGNIGFGTSNPVLETHTADGDSPGLRLEQDGSSGFTPQIWDIAGNETNFFVRDVTNGSKLPFRIRPGAPSSSIDISANGNVGVGTTTPNASVHIVGSSLFVEPDNGGERNNINALFRDSDSRVQIQLVTANSDWQIISEDDGSPNEGLSFTRAGTGTRELRITPAGGLIVAGTNLDVPDYVFEATYELMPLDQLKNFIDANGHLPNVDSAASVKDNGLNITGLSLKLLEKVEELTLYTLDQQNEIASLRATVDNLQEKLESSNR